MPHSANYARNEMRSYWLAAGDSGRSSMSEFMERFGKLTVAEAIELNKAAERSMGDPSAFELSE